MKKPQDRSLHPSAVNQFLSAKCVPVERSIPMIFFNVLNLCLCDDA